MDEYAEILQYLSPEELADLGIIPEQQQALEQQMAQANALRGAPLPEGRQAGGRFIAASPLEMLGGVAQRFAGALKGRGLEKQREALWDRQKAGRSKWLRATAGVPQAMPFSLGAELPDDSEGLYG